jgi:hypothetical protein
VAPAEAVELLRVGSPSVRDYVRRHAAESEANYYVGLLLGRSHPRGVFEVAEEAMPVIEQADLGS